MTHSRQFTTVATVATVAAAGLLAALAAGLASAAGPAAPPTPPAATPAPAPEHVTPASETAAVAGAPAADRAAILAMAGTFRVQFTFRETVAMTEGYTPAEPYETEAYELVTVIADEPTFISLQHVLVVDPRGASPMVVKHWRQDWRYEDGELLEYLGHDRWGRTMLPASAVRGTWSQSVHQTTDAPRYESIGRWTHEAGRSSWASGDTWRPLPRREHTVRDDYQVLGCRNRHTITPDGWVHEQDNRKLQLDAAGNVVGCLVHEIGINRYQRCDPELLAAGAAYWSRHAEAWAEIRGAWAQALDRDKVVIDESAGPPLPRLVSVALENPDVRRTLAERLTRYVGE